MGACITDNKAKKIVVLLCSLVLVVATVGLFIGNAKYDEADKDSPKRQWVIKERIVDIVSMGTSLQTHGEVFLGSGSVGPDPYYQYAIRGSRGGFVQQTPICGVGVEVIEDNNQKPCIIFCHYGIEPQSNYDIWGFLFSNYYLDPGSCPYYGEWVPIIYVPVGSIQYGYKINLQ